MSPKSDYRFGGFASPTYTQVPDALFDELLPQLTESELKVLLYIIRRTFGFKKASDDISLKQLVEGITTHDGRQLDHGAGVSKTSAVRGVNGLIEKQIIIAVRNRSKVKGDEPTTYQLHMVGHPVSKFETRGSANLVPARVPDLDTQETVEQQTASQDRANETSNIRSVHLNSNVDKYDDDRLALVDYLEGYAREFRDKAPLSSSVTRAAQLYRASGLDLDTFVTRMEQARAITKERTAAVKAGEGGRKQMMAYWFSVLESLIGQKSRKSS
jgi:hypothetical protein